MWYNYLGTRASTDAAEGDCDMLSMTGYGNGKAVLDGREVTVELKSVNHRYLDIYVKMPRKYVAEMLMDRIAASKTYLKSDYSQHEPLKYFLHGRGQFLLCSVQP